MEFTVKVENRLTATVEDDREQFFYKGIQGIISQA